MPSKTQFAFASSASNFTGGRRKGKGGSRNSHRRNQSEDTDNTDGAGSLTYSATSSVQSGGSAAGESTDSSFADIMRVLDMQDEKQLKEYIKKEGCTTVDELQKKRGWTTSGQSVTSSLAYSTDGESALEGTKLLQTIAGQANDNYGFDGGNTIEDEKLNLLFAPAAPAVVKKTKGNKVVLGKDKTTKRNPSSTHSRSSSNTSSSAYGTPEQKSRRHYSASPSSSTKSTPVKSPPSDPGTPPLPTRKQFTKDGVILIEDDDVWYKEWWMSCFPDAFKNLMPKR